MAQVKAIQACIKDEYGQKFPNAIAFIIDGVVNSQKRFTANSIGDEYKLKNSNDGMAYSVMYWYSEETKAQGFKARELRIDDGDGGFTNAITVDMEHSDYINIMNSAIPTDDKDMKVMEEDLKRKFV